MEPKFRFRLIGTRVIPCEDGIGLAGHEAPVDCRNMLLLKHWQCVLESAIVLSCHIFGADNGPAILPEALDARKMFLGRPIVMIRYDVRILSLELGQFRKSIGPDADRHRLGRTYLMRPVEHFFEQRQRRITVVAVARLVVQVPPKYTTVVLERVQDILDISLKNGIQGCGVGP